jgi:hypothetical protein
MSGGTYFVVNHATDTTKIDGLVESYQMIPIQYDDGSGNISTGFKRLNFVHWPAIPHPFVHEEWSDDLVFSNVYTPLLDDADDEEEDDEEEEYDDSEEEEQEFDGEEEEGTNSYGM